MRTRAEWHLNSHPVTHDVHKLVWNLEIDCMSVWCLCVVTEGICVVIIWCSWLSKGAPHKSLCKSILVISAKASSYNLFMREWTSVSHHPRVLFSSLALFYEEVSGLIPPTTLLFLCPVRSFFAALGAVNPWLQFPLSGGVRSGDYFKAGSHAPVPAHMAALKAGASSEGHCGLGLHPPLRSLCRSYFICWRAFDLFFHARRLSISNGSFNLKVMINSFHPKGLGEKIALVSFCRFQGTWKAGYVLCPEKKPLVAQVLSLSF